MWLLDFAMFVFQISQFLIICLDKIPWDGTWTGLKSPGCQSEVAPEDVHWSCKGVWEWAIGESWMGEQDGLAPCTFPVHSIHDYLQEPHIPFSNVPNEVWSTYLDRVPLYWGGRGFVYYSTIKWEQIEDLSKSVCLLWSHKARTKEKTNIWVSGWWKTKNKAEGSIRLTYTGLLGELEHLNAAWRKWNWLAPRSRSCSGSWTPEVSKKTVSFPMTL